MKIAISVVKEPLAVDGYLESQTVTGVMIVLTNQQEK